MSDVWNFSNDSEKSIFVGWMITNECNFRCSYEEWSNEIINIPYKKIALAITGGEPFLDFSNFLLLLEKLSQDSKIDNIRIDTNASWNLERIKLYNVNWKKIFFNISFHSKNWEEKIFFYKIKSMINYDLNISMINYVMTPEQSNNYERIREKFKQLNVKVNPAVYNNGKFPKKDEEVRICKKYLNSVDLNFKSGKVSPKGKFCKYPMIGVFMRGSGDISIGCNPKIVGNLYNDNFPKLPVKSEICKSDLCVCLHMYSFLEGIDRNFNSLNILQQYCNEAIL